MSGTVDELLHLAELARQRKAFVEARVHLKIAMMRDLTRPDLIINWGSFLSLAAIREKRCTITIWLLRRVPRLKPAREALKRLGRLDAQAERRKGQTHVYYHYLS